MIICFKLPCDTPLRCHPLYKLRKHIFRLLIDVSRAAIQLPAEQQGVVKGILVFPQILSSALASDTVMNAFWHGEVWETHPYEVSLRDSRFLLCELIPFTYHKRRKDILDDMEYSLYNQ